MNQVDKTLLKELLSDAKQDPITEFIARHGATKMNGVSGVSVDRERGWSDPPLTEEGVEEAKRAAEKLKGKGIRIIVASTLKRARQTAKIIGAELDIDPKFSAKLKPWNTGDITGKPMKQATPILLVHARDPDERVKNGESFNEFKRRVFEGLAEFSGDGVLLVAHHRVERLVAGWQKAGQPIEHAIDLRTFFAKGEPPGDVVTLKTTLQLLHGEIDKKLSHAEAKYEKPGHDGMFCKTCKYSDHQSPPTCAFVKDIEKAAYCERLWTKDPNAKPAPEKKPSDSEKKQAAFYG